MTRVAHDPIPELYIVLSDLDFGFSLPAVDAVASLWRDGVPLVEIAERVRGRGDRAQYEVALLVIDLARRGKVGLREGAIYGSNS